MHREVSQLWDEEKRFWIDQTEGRAVLSHRLAFAFCLRSWMWRVLFRLVLICTCWVCASMQQHNPNSYIYWMFLLYFTYTELVRMWKSYKSTGDQIKGFIWDYLLLRILFWGVWSEGQNPWVVAQTGRGEWAVERSEFWLMDLQAGRANEQNLTGQKKEDSVLYRSLCFGTPLSPHYQKNNSMKCRFSAEFLQDLDLSTSG